MRLPFHFTQNYKEISSPRSNNFSSNQLISFIGFGLFFCLFVWFFFVLFLFLFFFFFFAFVCFFFFLFFFSLFHLGLFFILFLCFCLFFPSILYKLWHIVFISTVSRNKFYPISVTGFFFQE